jgi:hypothetical protein
MSRPESPISLATPVRISAWGGGAFANHKTCRKLYTQAFLAFPLKHPEHRAGSKHAHLGQRLPDRGQGRRGPPGPREVVEAHDTDVLRYSQSLLADCLVHAQGHLVAGREDCSRSLGKLEQRAVGTEPRLVVEIAFNHEPRIKGEACGIKAGTVAVHTCPAAPQAGPASDETDPAVSDVGEVLCGANRPGPIGGTDGWDLEIRHAGGINHDSGHPQALQLRPQEGIEVCRHQDGAVAGPGTDIFQPLTGRRKVPESSIPALRTDRLSTSKVSS